MQAVWLAGEQSVAFCDDQGKLLKTVTLEPQPMKKAA
jgi:hypothetical protein